MTNRKDQSCGDVLEQALGLIEMRIIRLSGWFLLYLVATFCWMVLIEHGAENFLQGSLIELQDLQSFLVQLPSRFGH
jgi:hypothetical protein